MKCSLLKIAVACFLLNLFPVIYAQKTSDFKTYWELSGYTETPRYDQTIEYCKKLDEASPEITFITFGKSPQGRDLPLLIWDKDGFSKPAEVKKSGKIILLFQACVHAGESEGKDAGFELLRDIAIKNLNLNLDSITILFIPIFNVDGHERFTPYTRINQNGPKEAGWRTTATNLNLNRDYLKADAPEMQAWLKLYNEWNPDFFIDCHTTDGADYQYPVTIAYDGYSDSTLNTWLSDTYSPELIRMMEKSGYPVCDYYVSFRQWHNPRSGLVNHLPGPRFAGGYVAARNRFGLLIETHMLKDYKTRVLGTYQILEHTLEILAWEKTNMQSIIKHADSYTSSEKFRAKPFILESKPSMTDSVMIEFKGYEYSVEKSDLTGGNWFKYSHIPVNFLLPMYNRQTPSIMIQLPEAYIIPAEWSEIIKKLRLHGIKYITLTDSITLPIETYRFFNPKWSAEPYESHQVIELLEIDTLQISRNFESGSVIVPTNQQNARLLAYMFEPQTEESFLRWGYFNSIFEQKEYVETYVMEKMAREMIRENPELKIQLEILKNKNPEFANDSYAQLMWFYKQTPYYDQNVGLYPVGKINSKSIVEMLVN
jgi:hypothetical protein